MGIEERVKALETEVYGLTDKVRVSTKKEWLHSDLHRIFHNFRCDEIMRKHTGQWGDTRLNQAVAETMKAISDRGYK